MMKPPAIRLTNAGAPRVGIIIPACNEEPCIASVIEELLAAVDLADYAIAVGVNNSSDRTAEIARRFPVIVAETNERGYGYGCQVAIDALRQANPSIRAYIFFAGDGASDPRDIAALLAAFDQDYSLVLGARTTRRSNWPTMTLPHVLANFALGSWCGLLTGCRFRDLAPLRLVDRELFETLAPHEMTFGWTIELQVGAAMLRANICELPAHERKRIAGAQKVSGVTWRRTFSIGCRILAAGWRARRRYRRPRPVEHRWQPVELVAQSETGA